MTYYGAKELAASFRTVRKNTIRIAQDIPEDKYSFGATPETRTVEKTLVHIAQSYRFQHQIHAVDHLSSLDGFDFVGLVQRMAAEEEKSRTKTEVIDLLQKEGETWAGYLDGLSEAFLAENVRFPEGATPPTKSRLEMILSAKEHEMHHRAQLMLVERMLGIVPHLTREREERMAQARPAANN